MPNGAATAHGVTWRQGDDGEGEQRADQADGDQAQEHALALTTQTQPAQPARQRQPSHLSGQVRF
jgi:hypothetical protein